MFISCLYSLLSHDGHVILVAKEPSFVFLDFTYAGSNLLTVDIIHFACCAYARVRAGELLVKRTGNIR